jgi:hypothetical protein
MRGLLVGAGFSLEFGMPLVSQLDEEIYGQLTPEKKYVPIIINSFF